MGVQFNSSDILEIAVRIEENGGNFYRFAVQLSKDDRTKKIFQRLAEDEDRHGKIFKKLLSNIEVNSLPEGYADEYVSYLRNYVDSNIIFTKEAMERELMQINDVSSALNFAIRREMDSILYYQEIKSLLAKDQHKVIDGIIGEERSHFETLSALRTAV